MRGLIIIPAFNEEAVIGQTLKNLQEKNSSWDIVVINDGSRDNTRAIVESQGIDIINLPMNLGIGTAVQTGYKWARRKDYDWTLQFDADGQHLADEIEVLLKHLEGAACVIGSRYIKKTDYRGGKIRRFGSFYFSILLKILGCPSSTDPTSGFRLCDRRATAFFAHCYPLDYPEVESRLMLHRRKLLVREVSVSMADRQGGHSSISSLAAFYYMFKVTLSLLLGGGR